MLLSGKDKSANLKEWQMPCAELICLSLPPSASAHNSSMLFSIIVREGRNWGKKGQSNDRKIGKLNLKNHKWEKNNRSHHQQLDKKTQWATTLLPNRGSCPEMSMEHPENFLSY